MPKFRYGIIGGGRWGRQIARIIREHAGEVSVLEISRRGSGESRETYQERVGDYLGRHACGIDIVWVAVPPVDQGALVKSVLRAEKHCVSEKPWICDHDETNEILNLADSCGSQIAIHYQYCFLSALPPICRSIDPMDKSCVFSGEFTISRENRLFVPALYNLGSHLMAIKCCFFPAAKVGCIKTGYNRIDRRSIRIRSDPHDFTVDFWGNKEPIVQRFIDAFEQSLSNDREYFLNLKLALKVNEQLGKLEGKASATPSGPPAGSQSVSPMG